ncbi:MAG TPA: hypothetical protein VE177_08070, partial [Candidatus Binatus sp.]|nr:hypothetical protein [Candidatus Binatus sp.]
MRDNETGWLVDASHESGTVDLVYLRAGELQPFHWSDSSFKPYYLTDRDVPINGAIPKLELLTGREKKLRRVYYETKPPKGAKGWELEVAPELSYAYDNQLHFGLLHTFRDGRWQIQHGLDPEQEKRLGQIQQSLRTTDPLKLSILRDVYSILVQPIPSIDPDAIGVSGKDWSKEEYYRAMVLSRLSNLPLSRTYQSHQV